LLPRLDEADLKTITSNPKYKALKKETMDKDSNGSLVILTKAGVAYLKETCGADVDKNGVKRQERNACTPISAKRHKNAQKVDNDLLNLVLPFFTDPEM
jgi:hypothetical protein